MELEQQIEECKELFKKKINFIPKWVKTIEDYQTYCQQLLYRLAEAESIIEAFNKLDQEKETVEIFIRSRTKSWYSEIEPANKKKLNKKK